MESIQTNLPIEESSTMSKDLGELASALSKAQGELQSSKKDSQGYGYSYADLATVINEARTVLSKNGLAVTQLLGKTRDGSVSVVTLLLHASGQYLKTTTTMPIVEMNKVNDAQRIGATVSYLRRYAYQAIIGMASEDNDASTQGFKTDSSGKVDLQGSAQPSKGKGFRESHKAKLETANEEGDL